MCSDELEGLSLISGKTELDVVVSELDKKILKKVVGKSKSGIINMKIFYRISAIAALLILFFGLTFLIINYMTKPNETIFTEQFEPYPVKNQPNKVEKNKLADNIEKEENVEFEEKSTQLTGQESKKITDYEITPVVVLEKESQIADDRKDMISFPENEQNREAVSGAALISDLDTEEEFADADDAEFEPVFDEILEDENQMLKTAENEKSTNLSQIQTQLDNDISEESLILSNKQKKLEKRDRKERSNKRKKSSDKIKLSENMANGAGGNADEAAEIEYKGVTFANIETDDSSSDSPYTSLFENAMIHYENAQYQSAIENFEKFLSYQHSDNKALFYCAVSYLSIDKTSKALEYLNKVIESGDSEMLEAANWYKALSLIKTGQKRQAKKLLKTIAKGSGEYKQKAKEVLEDF
jgi:TolA-binding protein